MTGRSLRTQLLLGSLVPALVCLLAAGGVGYALARRTLEQQLGQGLAADAALIASQVSRVRLASVEPGDDVRGTRSYRSLLRQLEQMRDGSGARRVFVVDSKGRVRGDAGGGLPVGAEVPELSRDRVELERARNGVPSSSQVLFTGPDGRLYRTGYAAVLDRGVPVAVVGVEGSAALYEPLSALARSYALLVSLALAALAIVSVGLARGLSRPLRELMNAAVRIGQGELTRPVPSTSTREVSVLARELELMRQALLARDRQLQLMLAGIAHEVKNPLGGIELFTGLLREALPEGEARSHVDRIRGEVDYLERVVEEFLAFAREQKVTHLTFPVERWVASVVPLVSDAAEAKTVVLESDVEPAKLLGDEGLLNAALLNLCRNAIQAAPPGSRVTVRGRQRGGEYWLEVRDQGPGVPANLQDRIFEPFFSTREKGTGLGLPLARKILQAHGGSVLLTSQPGDTVFRAVLPLSGRLPVAPGAAGA